MISPAPDVARIIARLAARLERWTGLDLTRGSAHGALARYICAQLPGPDPEAVARYVDGMISPQQPEVIQIIDAITVCHSAFYRDPDQLAAIAAVLAAELTRPAAIWVPACATGEDAYSIAMIAASVGRRARVLATDINTRALAQAARGLYGAWSVRDLPEALALPRREDGRYEVTRELRDAVVLARHNLMDPPPRAAPGSALAAEVPRSPARAAASDEPRAGDAEERVPARDRGGARDGDGDGDRGPERAVEPGREVAASVAAAAGGSPDAGGGWDLIVCRNVLMYLARPRVAELLRRLAEALRPGGYLFVGAGDILDRAPPPLQFVWIGARSALWRPPIEGAPAPAIGARRGLDGPGRPAAAAAPGGPVAPLGPVAPGGPVAPSGGVAGAPAGPARPLPRRAPARLPAATTPPPTAAGPARPIATTAPLPGGASPAEPGPPAARPAATAPPAADRGAGPEGAASPRVAAGAPVTAALARALTLLERSDPPAALDLLLGVLAADPLCTEARLLAGIAYHLAGDALEAAAALRAALALAPDLWPAELYLGLALDKLGDEAGSVRALRRAAALAAAARTLPLSPVVAGWLEAWRVDAIAMGRGAPGRSA